MSKSQKITHRFFCMACGQEGIPLARSKGHQHKKLHRKKLYCTHCQAQINHIECKTYDDVQTFIENFQKGIYINEAKESMAYGGTSRKW